MQLGRQIYIRLQQHIVLVFETARAVHVEARLERSKVVLNIEVLSRALIGIHGGHAGVEARSRWILLNLTLDLLEHRVVLVLLCGGRFGQLLLQHGGGAVLYDSEGLAPNCRHGLLLPDALRRVLL